MPGGITRQVIDIDPLAEVTGRDQIDAVIAAAQAQFAGMKFRLAAP